MASNLEYKFVIHGITVAVQSLDGMNAALKTTNQWLGQAKLNSESFVKALSTKNEIITAKANLLSTNTALQGTTQASSNAAMALLNLNYVIRDSPYFFQNFALGVLAVGNNLNPLIDSFARLRKEAGEKSISTFELLKKALVGGAGISIAFSLVVTAIQAFVFWQARSKKAVEETNKSLKDQYDKLQELSRAGLVKTQVETLNQIRQLEDAMLGRLTPEGREATLEYRGREESLRIMFDAEKNKADKEKLTLLKDQVAYINVLLAGNASIRKIENEISVLKERQKDETVAQSLETEKSIKLLEKMKNAFLGVEEKAKKIKETFGATPPLIRQIVDAVAELNKQMALLGLGGGSAGTGGGGLRPGGLRQMPTNPIIDTLKQIERDLKEEFAPTLKLITDAANTAGNAISNAFLTGKNVIDAATQALIQFITQLLVVQTLMGILTAIFVPGGSFLSGFMGGMFLKPAVPSGGALNKNSAVRVTGKITADKNNFIANIRNADNYYSRNEEFVVIGR